MRRKIQTKDKFHLVCAWLNISLCGLGDNLFQNVLLHSRERLVLHVIVKFQLLYSEAFNLNSLNKHDTALSNLVQPTLSEGGVNQLLLLLMFNANI